MQLTEVMNEGLLHRLEGSVEQLEIDAWIDAEVEKAAPGLAWKGFRKGKIPNHLIKARMGRALRSDAVDAIVSDALKEHCDAASITPAETVTPVHEGLDRPSGDVSVTVEFERMPELPPLDIESIEVTKPVLKNLAAATDVRVDGFLMSCATFSDAPADYRCGLGDEVDYEICAVSNGMIVEDSKQQFTCCATRADLLPARMSVEPEFDFIDAAVGDRRDLGKDGLQKLDPEYHESADSAELRILAIRTAISAELTEETAKESGFESVEDLKSAAEEAALSEFSAGVRKLMIGEIKDEIVSRTNVEMPKCRVSKLVELHNDYKLEAESLKNSGAEETAVSSLKEKYMEPAERMLKFWLQASKLALEKDLQVDERDLRNWVNEVSTTVLEREQLYESIRIDRDIAANVRWAVLEKKVLNHLLSSVRCSEEEIEETELQNRLIALARKDQVSSPAGAGGEPESPQE